jgi:DNA-binding beta-propeller fold protein YncE
LGFNPLTHRVYVSDYDEKQEIVLDGFTNKIVARINLIRQPDGVDVDIRTNRVWVALDGPGGNVDILDGFKNTVEKTFSVGDTFIMGVAVNPFTRRVYISSELAPASLFVIDARTQQTIATVPIGLFGNSVALDQLSNLIFATDGQGNTLTVVNGRNNTVRKVIPLNALFPVYVAANPVTEHVYVSGFASGLVDVISERSPGMRNFPH